MEDFDRLKAMKDVLVDDATVRRQLDVITKLQQEIQQERRWKEAAQRENEKLARYISELRTALLLVRPVLTDCVTLKFDRTLENRCSDCLSAITKVLNEGKAS